LAILTVSRATHPILRVLASSCYSDFNEGIGHSFGSLSLDESPEQHVTNETNPSASMGGGASEHATNNALHTVYDNAKASWKKLQDDDTNQFNEPLHANPAHAPSQASAVPQSTISSYSSSLSTKTSM
jgi:hypothetical protein